MSEKKGFIENLGNGQTWLRGIFMLLFVLIYSVTEVIVLVVVVLQFLFVLFSGQQNTRLREFGEGLSVFVYQIMSYWTYNSEEKPFPFAQWPGGESAASEE
jgi:D-alanyl-lipoteichoic acid acyltransferase DltB (MBOAT superfamily)